MDVTNDAPAKAPVLLVWAKAALGRLRRKAPGPVADELDFDDIDHMQAWSISCRLAAVPMDYLDRVPPEVASLMRQAKELHPQMAAGAADRDARGEPCPPL